MHVSLLRGTSLVHEGPREVKASTMLFHSQGPTTQTHAGVNGCGEQGAVVGALLSVHGPQDASPVQERLLIHF